MKIELFDFAELIGASIEFDGSFSKRNTYVNVHLRKNGSSCTISGRSAFGRSEKPDLDQALADFVDEIKGHLINFDHVESYQVPKELVHTKGLRPKSKKVA